MPTYSFQNKETQEVFDIFFKTIALKDEYLEQNPSIQQIHTSSIGVVDPIRIGLRKPDDAFRDKLKDIKRAHRRSTINTF